MALMGRDWAPLLHCSVKRAGWFLRCAIFSKRDDALLSMIEQ